MMKNNLSKSLSFSENNKINKNEKNEESVIKEALKKSRSLDNLKEEKNNDNDSQNITEATSQDSIKKLISTKTQPVKKSDHRFSYLQEENHLLKSIMNFNKGILGWGALQQTLNKNYLFLSHENETKLKLI